MLGGVVGFNKGKIAMSGSSITADVMRDVTEETTAEQLNKFATEKGKLSKDDNYVGWSGGSEIEKLSYDGGSNVAAGRMQMHMSSNGNLGGITAFNGTTGSVNKCVSGNWFLVNKSQVIGVGTGGIIGMNESEQDLSYLVNGAFVGRQLATSGTGLPVELSEIRTTSLPMDGRLKNVLTMERYTAITAIILAELWDSGREPVEP